MEYLPINEIAKEEGSSTLLIRNSDKYILTLDGKFAKDELTALANKNEINGL